MNNLVEFVGYAASFFVVASFTINHIKLLRTINLVGAFLFVVYGCLIQRWPVIIPNILIVLIQIRFFLRNKPPENAP